MTSDKTFMNRFFAALAIHSPGQEIHYKLVQLEQTYHVPRIDIRQLLAQWAHQGFIQLNFCPRFLLQTALRAVLRFSLPSRARIGKTRLE